MADQRPIGFWLKLVDRLIDERFEGVLDEHGVTRRQWQLLNLLRRGPATQEELDVGVAPFLAASTANEQAASSAADVEELVDSEWVSPSVSGYVLTPRGEQSVERLSEVVDGIRSSIGAEIEPADYDTTTRTLERMATNLGWREATATASPADAAATDSAASAPDVG